MPQERHKLLSRLIDRSTRTSVALVFVLAAAMLTAAFGLLGAQYRLADAYRTLIAADAITGQVQAMRLSMAGWLLRADDGSRAEWMRLAHEARSDAVALDQKASSDPTGRALVDTVVIRLVERIDTAAPLLAHRSTTDASAPIASVMSANYQERNAELSTALERLRAYQSSRVESLQAREHLAVISGGTVLLVLVSWAAVSLRRARRTAGAIVRGLQDAYRNVERGRAELAAFNDAAPLAVFHLDAKGHPVRVNAQAMDWLAATTVDEVPSLFARLLHSADRPRVGDAWRRLLDEGERFDEVFRLLDETDSVRWLAVHAVPVRVDGATTGLIAVMQDITTTRALQDELGRSRTRLQRMTDAVPAMMAHVDVTETYLFVNATYASWFGSAAPTVGTTIEAFLGETAYRRLKPSIDGVLAGHSVRLEMAQDNLHGLAFVGDVTYTPEFDEAGRVCGFYVLVTDITERKRLEDGLYAAKEMAQVTLDSLGDAVITTDEHGVITFLNRRAQVLLEPRTSHALGVHVDKVVSLVDALGRLSHTSLVRAIEDEITVDMLAPRKLLLADGSYLDVEDASAPIRARDGLVVGGVLVLRDVSVAQSLADRMRQLAESDALTGLPNRLVFDERLFYALRQLPDGDQIAVLFMDLDGFKTVNDAHGHVAGDELLRQVAGRLADTVRPADTVCRIGGDEFVALLASPIDHLTALACANRLIEVAAAPYAWNGQALHVTLSVGIALAREQGNEALTLLRRADTALYDAKQAGKNRARLYSSAVVT